MKNTILNNHLDFVKISMKALLINSDFLWSYINEKNIDYDNMDADGKLNIICELSFQLADIMIEKCKQKYKVKPKEISEKQMLKKLEKEYGI
jgi:hypothetical protein